MQYEPFAQATKKLKAGSKRTKWIEKVISGEVKGRHQRTTLIYKPKFMKLKDDLPNKKEIIEKLIGSDLL